MQTDISSNIILLCYFGAWLLVFLVRKANSWGFTSGMFIAITYAGYAIVSLLLYNNAYYGHYFSTITVFPFVYLFVMLMIAQRPISHYEGKNIRYIQKPSNYLITGFIVIYGICAFVALPQSLSTIRQSFTNLLNDSGAGSELYLNARANYSATDSAVSGLFGLVNIFHNFFRDISIFILFYYLSLKERKRLTVFFLMGIMIVDMLLSIANGGRTLVAMMLLAIGIAYFTFRDFWNEKYRKTMKWIAIVILGIIAVAFIGFTISRIRGARAKYTTADSLTYYIGQANLYFNNRILSTNGTRNGDRTIQEFKRVLGMETPVDILSTRAKYSYMTINDSVFSTFVGDFVLDFGAVPAFFIFVVISVFFSYITRCRDDQIQFHKLLAIYFVGCVCAQGGMYLFYYSYQRNWMIVAAALMYLVFYIDYHVQLSRGGCKYLYREVQERKRKVRVTLGKKTLL